MIGKNDLSLVHLARRLEELKQQSDQFDRTEFRLAVNAENGLAESAQESLVARMREETENAADAIETAIATQSARTLRDAAVQILLACAYVDAIQNLYKEAVISGREGDIDALLGKTEKLINSALAVVARRGKLDLLALGGDRYAQLESLSEDSADKAQAGRKR